MFKDLSVEETESINGGGAISCIAGAAAGAIVGGYAAIGAAATGHSASDCGKCILTGATIGACCVFLP